MCRLLRKKYLLLSLGVGIPILAGWGVPLPWPGECPYSSSGYPYPGLGYPSEITWDQRLGYDLERILDQRLGYPLGRIWDQRLGYPLPVNRHRHTCQHITSRGTTYADGNDKIIAKAAELFSYFMTRVSGFNTGLLPMCDVVIVLLHYRLSVIDTIAFKL